MAHHANGWDWPDDRPEAAPVKIKLDKAKPSTMFHDEATVSFALGDRKFHGWMPHYAVVGPFVCRLTLASASANSSSKN